MSAITNFPFVKSIRFLLQPLGYVLSDRQQTINKAALAILIFTCGLIMTEAQGSAIQDADSSRNLEECLTICSRIKTWYRTSLGRDLLENCNRFCARKWDLLQLHGFRDT